MRVYCVGMKKVLIGLVSIFALVGCSVTPTSQINQTPTGTLDNQPLDDVQSSNSAQTKDMNSIALLPAENLLKLKAGQTMQAVIKTSLGDITVDLFADKTPKTVANFVGLAEGTQPWINPSTGELQENKPLYNGVIFHRVIKDFMIQGGDPLGLGMGGPGYKFEDEIVPELQFNEPGLLAMANAGPGTNGSQFFITTVPTTWLNGKHTIFGKVVKGMDVVSKIENVQTGAGDKPTQDVTIESIQVIRK